MDKRLQTLYKINFQLDQSVKDLLSQGQNMDDPTSDEDIIADTSEALGKIITVDVQDHGKWKQ